MQVPEPKYVAVQEYFPHGWKAQVLVTLDPNVSRYFTMAGCPLFATPREAIAWAKEND